MPAFDFDTVIDRRQSDSIKWRQPAGVLPLWVADADFSAPPAVIEALHRRVAHGVFGYAAESPTLRQTVVQWVADHYGWAIEPDWLIFPPDVMRGMNWTAQTLARPGEGVLLQSPVYGPFFDVVKNGDFQLQDVPLQQDDSGRYRFDMEAMAATVHPQTRIFMLCNPQNPTGRVFSRQELAQVAEFCLQHDLNILADEIHADLIYDGHHHVPIASLDPEVAQRTITFIAPSKTFNLAGLKAAVGIIPNAELRKRLQESARGLIAHVNLLGMVAMETAYAQGGLWLAELMSYLQQNRDHVYQVVQQWPGVHMTLPEGTFLAWLDFRQTAWAAAPGKAILEQARVLLNEGNWFGRTGTGFARLNYACPRSTLDEALLRIQQALPR